MGKFITKVEVIILGTIGVFILAGIYITPIAFGGGQRLPAPVISNIAVTYITSTSAIVNWSTDVLTTGSGYYGLSVKSTTNGSGGSPGPVLLHSAVFHSLKPATKYYFYVDATNQSINMFSKSSNGSFLTLSSSAPDTTPPTDPALSGQAVSDSQIDLSWTPSTDASGIAEYRVFRNGYTVGIVNGVTTKYTDIGLGDGGLKPGTIYNYSVKASDAMGNWNGSSATVPVQTLGGIVDATAPSTPAGLSVTAVTSAAISLSWSPSTDNIAVQGYKIFRNGVQIATTGSSSFYDSGLAQLTMYTYSVAAYDAAGNNSANSVSTSATTLATPLATTTPTATTTP